MSRPLPSIYSQQAIIWLLHRSVIIKKRMGPKDIFDALLKAQAAQLLSTGSSIERVTCGSSRLILASSGSAVSVCLIQFRSKKFATPEQPISPSRKPSTVEASRARSYGATVARWILHLHQGFQQLEGLLRIRVKNHLDVSSSDIIVSNSLMPS